MVQLFLAKTLITFVTGCTLGQLLVAAITDSPIKRAISYLGCYSHDECNH